MIMNNKPTDSCSDAKIRKINSADSSSSDPDITTKNQLIKARLSAVSNPPTNTFGNHVLFSCQGQINEQPSLASNENKLHVDSDYVIEKKSYQSNTEGLLPGTNTEHVLSIFVDEKKASLKNESFFDKNSEETCPKLYEKDDYRNRDKLCYKIGSTEESKNCFLISENTTGAEKSDESKDKAKSMNILAFCNLLGKLKHLPRAGWLKYKIDRPEPVAGHMYRMAVLAFCLDDYQTSYDGTNKKNLIDKNKCIKLALVHDMAESIVGDITPHCGISAEEKYRRENEGMLHIATLVPEKLGTEMYELWQEYEKQSSPEAVMVKQLDKFDLIAQAYEYELDAEKPKYLQEFFDSTSKSIKNEPVLSWAKQLLEQREKLAKEKEETNSPQKTAEK